MMKSSQCKPALRLLPWFEFFLCAVAYIHKEYESGDSTFMQTYAHDIVVYTTMMYYEATTNAT